MKRLIYLFWVGIFASSPLFSSSLIAQCGGFAVNITADPQPPYNLLCPGTVINLTTSVTGGTAPYTYSWSNGASTPNTSVTVPFNGNVNVSVFDANGCVAFGQIHIKALIGAVSITYNPAPVCQGDSLLLTAAPPFPPGTVSYAWSNGATEVNTYVSASGTYSVTVSNIATGCTGTASSSIFFSPEPTPLPVLIGPSSLCAGQSATLSVDGGPFPIYYWNTAETEPTIDITGPGLYWVSVANASLCWTTDTLVITAGSATPVLTGPAGLCAGQSATISLTNASSFTDFDWSTGASTPSITVSAPGTYSVTVSAGSGCSSTGSFTVTSNGSNINLTGTTTAVTSCTSPNGSVNLSFSPPGSYTFDWSNGASTEDLADVAAGTYTVTATDAGGCSANASFTVTTNTTTPFILSNVTPASCGQSNGAIDLNVTPPAGNFSYEWSNGATTQDLPNVTPGDYSVTVTLASNGCTSTASANVGNTSATLNITGTVTQPSSGQNNGAIDVSVSPSGTYTYNWSNGATTEDLSNLAPGNYTVTVSAGGNCSATATFSLTINCAITLDFNSYYNFCDPTTLYLEANPTGGTPPYTYQWETGETTQTIIVPNVADQYFATVTDAAGCVEIDFAHVKPQPAGPLYPFNNNGCEGDTTTLFLNWIRDSFPGTTYLWSTGATTPTIDITTSGVYNVTVTSPPNGCTYVSTIDFTMHAHPEPQIVGPATLCPGNTTTLSVTGGNFSSIFWLPQQLYEPTVVVTDPGTYIVYAWLNNITFCPGADTLIIAPGDISPPVLTGTTTLCTGQSGNVIISNSNEYTDFLWSNGATTPSISINAPGNYSVTVTDAGGCTATGSFNVNNDPNSPAASTDQTPAFCGESNGSVDLTVSPPGAYTYSWSNGSTSEDLANLSAGTYSVTITSSGGCSATSTAVVPENTPNIVLSGNTTANSSCLVNTGGVDLNVSPSGTYNFDWSNGATTEDLLNVAPGSYSVTVSTGLSCSSSANFTVADNPIVPNLATNPSPATCNQNNGSIDLNPSGSNSPFTFDWSNGSNLEDLSDLPPGNYTVTVTGSNGCTSAATATVTSSTIPVSVNGAASPNTECGGSTGSIDITPTPSGAYDFVWSNGASTEDLANLLPGAYSVTATLGGNCSGTATFVVEDNSAQPTASGIVAANTSCNSANGSIDLTVSPPGAYNFSWSNGGATEDLSSIASGSYSVTVTDGNNCSSTASFVVTNEVISPALSFFTTPAACGQNNGSINLTVSPSAAYTFLWSNGASSQNLQSVAAGTYFVTVSNSQGCTTTGLAEVANENTGFTLSGATTANTTCIGSDGAVDLTVSPSGNYTFLWSNGAASEDLQNVAAGNFSVTVTGSNGCFSTSSFSVANNSNSPAATTTTTPEICGQTNGGVDLSVLPSGNYILIWSNGATVEDLQNVSAGNYSVTVTGANGCTAVASADVANNAINFNLTGTTQANTSCSFPNGVVDLNVSPSGSYTYSWSNGASLQDLQNVSAGNFSVTVTALGNCTATASFVVVNNSGAPALAVVSSPGFCGQTSGSVDITVSPSGAYTYIWSNGAVGEDLQNVVPGSYSVTVTSSNGCVSTASALVADSTLSFTADASVSPNSSCTAADGSIDLSVSASGNFNYLWSNGATSQDLQNLSAGDYSVTISQGLTCSSSATYNVPASFSSPVLTQSFTPAICGASNGGIDLAVTPAVGNNFIWSNGSASEDLLDIPSGNYSVTVTALNGCTATAAFDVPNNSNNFSLSASTADVTNCNAANGLVNLTVSPAGAYTFIWSNNAISEDLQAVSAGIYSVTVSDGTSCTASASYTVNSNVPAVNLTGVSTPVSCFGSSDGSISLTPGGGSSPYVFTWSPVLPGNPQNPVQLAAGNYSVTTTDANGCTASANFNIGQPASGVAITCQTTANASAPGALDGSGSVSMQGGTAPYFISWTPGGVGSQPVTGDDFILNNLSEGSYSVTVTDTNGCPENCSFVISSASQPCITAVGTMQTATVTACGNNCISANYSVAGQMLENGDVLQFILHQGNASQIVGEIARNAEPVFCFDASQMTFGTPYFISAVVGEGDGTGNVFLSDPCTAVSLGTPIVFHEKPVASATGENITCLQNEAQLSGTSSLSGSQFQWATQGGTFAGSTTGANATATSAGFYTLFVSKNGCTDTTEMQVLDLRNQPVAAIDSDSDNTLNCSVDNISLTGSYAGSSDGSMFWFSNGNLIGTGSSLTVQQAGIYQFVILDTVTFCSDSAAMQIFDNQTYPPVFVNTPPVLNCQQTTVTLTGGSTVGGIEFAWAAVVGVDTTILGEDTSLTVSSPGTYFLIATDPENGCVNAASQAVFANTGAPLADAGENQTLDCYETPVTLAGSAFPDNVSFAWSSPGVAISDPASPEITVNEAGTFTLVVMRLDNFCRDTATVQVLDYQTAVQSQVIVEPPTCNGGGNGSIYIQTDPAHAPYKFVANGKSYGSNPHLMALSAGEYSLQVIDNQGCEWTASVTVPDPPMLELNLGADLFVKLGQTVTLTAQVSVPPSALEAVLWQPDSLFNCPVDLCLQQEIMPIEQTEVRLTVIDTFGCKASDRLLLFVKKDVDVYIPNTFSPNGDGVNDTFTIYGDPSEIEEIVEFQIFQRWGEFVYKYEHFPPNDPLYGWDGTFNGTLLNSQVFVYWVVVKFTDGTEGFFEGGITLLR